LKTTFPYPRFQTSGTYACLKLAEDELLPKNPGEHGIVIVKSISESLVFSKQKHGSRLIIGSIWIYSVRQRQEQKRMDLLWNI